MSCACSFGTCDGEGDADLPPPQSFKAGDRCCCGHGDATGQAGAGWVVCSDAVAATNDADGGCDAATADVVAGGALAFSPGAPNISRRSAPCIAGRITTTQTQATSLAQHVASSEAEEENGACKKTQVAPSAVRGEGRGLAAETESRPISGRATSAALAELVSMDVDAECA